MTNRDILNRELINHLFVRLFNQISDIEAQYMVGHGVEDLSLSELHNHYSSWFISLRISKKNIRRLYEWIKNIVNWLLCTTTSS